MQKFMDESQKGFGPEKLLEYFQEELFGNFLGNFTKKHGRASVECPEENIERFGSGSQKELFYRYFTGISWVDSSKRYNFQ